MHGQTDACPDAWTDICVSRFMDRQTDGCPGSRGQVVTVGVLAVGQDAQTLAPDSIC